MDDEIKSEERSPFEADKMTGAPFRNVKDSVFKELFAEPRYLLQLYQTLHPEDTQTTVDDLELVTLETVIVKDIYNDLGFAVGDKLIILAEAQSTWSVNIILRSLFYLVRTYQDYFKNTKQSLYNTKAVTLPRAELYVIYTGESKVEKKEISLSEEFFGGKPCAVETKVKVIVGGDGDDIINQYIIFSKVITEQIRQYGQTARAVEEAIRICKDRNVLKEFLECHEKEAVDIMVQLFSQEEVLSDFLISQREEGRAEGEAVGEARGRAEGREEGRAEGEARGREESAQESAANLHAMGWSAEQISAVVPYSTETIRSWLEFS